MQFSVIVEGPTDGETTSEDALLELERFLRASDIPAHVIQALKKGQPQVLKNQLSYEQAVSISDRLMDLGLESIIDPPTKPEISAKKVSTKTTSVSPSNVTPIKPRNVTNKTASSNSTSKNSKHQINKKPTLAVVHSPAQKPAQRQAMVKTKNTGSGTQTAAQRPAMAQVTPPNKPLSSTQSHSASTRHTANSINSTVQAGVVKSKTPPPVSSSLSKAAAEIKALFHLPTNGAVEISLPITARMKLILVACLCLAVPTLYAAIWFSLFYLTISLSIFLYVVLADLSLSFALITASIPMLLFATTAILTNLPLLKRHSQHNNQSNSQLVLRAKDEPKLFLLVTAISKVFKAPAPATLTLDASSHIHARQDSSFLEFVKLNNPLQGDIHLSIGSVVMQNLSIRDFCSLVAKEIGIFAHPQLQRPQWIIQGSMEKFSQLRTPYPNFEHALQKLNDKINFSFAQRPLAFIANLSEKLQAVCCAYFEHADQLIKLCFGVAKPISSQYQLAILSDSTSADEAVSELIDTLIHIEASHDLAIDELIGETPKPRLAKNLALYTQYLFNKNEGPASIGKPEAKTGLVRSTKAINTLIDNFDVYACTITQQYYQACGLNLEEHELCSLKELFQQEAKDQKFSQASDIYFNDWIHPLQFWRLPTENLLPNSQSDAIINRLNNCIARVRYVSPDRQASVQRYDKLLKQYSEMKAAKKVLASGNSFQFLRSGESAKSLDRDLALRKAQIKELQDELRQQNAIMGERLALGLLLDKQHKGFAAKLFHALSAYHSIGEKAMSLACTIDELEHILRHKPKNQAQQYQLYVRELTETVRDTEKFIRRKLLNCPYDIIDRRYANLAEFVNAQQPEYDTLNITREQLIVQRSKDTLAAVNWAYKQINQRAAYIAASMEREFGVETVKKMEKANV